MALAATVTLDDCDQDAVFGDTVILEGSVQAFACYSQAVEVDTSLAVVDSVLVEDGLQGSGRSDLNLLTVSVGTNDNIDHGFSPFLVTEK